MQKRHTHLHQSGCDGWSNAQVICSYVHHHPSPWLPLAISCYMSSLHGVIHPPTADVTFQSSTLFANRYLCAFVVRLLCPLVLLRVLPHFSRVTLSACSDTLRCCYICLYLLSLSPLHDRSTTFPLLLLNDPAKASTITAYSCSFTGLLLSALVFCHILSRST